ncbi:MAG: SLBB domain-containing protein, partial [Bacillota bacterium]|nr:SLBB domain-containing protein [Bacillota bacterium]
MIGSAAILIIFLLFLTVGYILSKPKAQINDKDVFADSSNVVDGDDNKAADKKDSVNSNISSIKVEVKGQVKNPGVYELTNGSRIEDLIIKAGGFMPDADIDSIVQVKKLKDEDCIVVKKKGEAGSGNSLASAASSSISSDGKVDINTATKEELDKVSGIG